MHLTEENAQHYRHYSNKQQEEWFESTHSLETRIEHETERLEDWFGHLSDQQIKLIENRASIVKNEQQIRIANHLSWREAYLQAAINRDTTLLRSWLNDLSIFWTPEYTQLKQHNDQQRQALVFELLPTLSPKQKRHAREKVEDWIEKLKDISQIK
jgi:predicted HAD superfamily phosphohydrolase YqeG